MPPQPFTTCVGSSPSPGHLVSSIGKERRWRQRMLSQELNMRNVTASPGHRPIPKVGSMPVGFGDD